MSIESRGPTDAMSKMCWRRALPCLTSDSSFSKKRSSAGFCARGRTTVRLVVLGEKATLPWDSISF